MREIAKPETTALRPWQLALVYLAACVIIFSRRPDALFHAQFWAEDGVVWFSQAYNDGWWQPLFRTEVGYFQTLPRLAAALALLVPLAHAPLICNLVAVAVEAIPATLLLSTRSREWGSLSTRAAIVAIYLALPTCPELSAIITDAQWALALTAFLVLVAAAPSSKPQFAFDFAVLILCGLTGPFCILLFPIALYLAWTRRQQRSPQLYAPLIGCCCLIQAYSLFFKNNAERSSAGLGATPMLFIRMLAGDIYLGALIGPTTLPMKPGTGFALFLILFAICGTALIVLVLRKAPRPMTLMAVFAILSLTASLISPSTVPQPGISKWELIARAAAVRYWFYPSLVFLWSLIFGVRTGSRPVKVVSAALLFVLAIGVVLRWHRPAFADTHFADQARRFEALPPGTPQDFPENPDGWTFRLVKR